MSSHVAPLPTPPASPPSQADPVSKQIVGLDLLRIVAAALVVVYHLCFYDWSPRAPAIGPPLHDFDRWSAFTNFGWVGVEIFFVISGFVIAYSAQAARASVFAVHRLLRLLPAAMICATISALALYSQGSTPLPRLVALWLRSICLLPLPGVDGSYWTLPIEVTFYALVFALLLAKQIRRLPLVIGTLGLVSTLLWVPMAAHRFMPGLLSSSYFQALHQASAGLQLIAYGSSFAVGVLLWLCLNHGWSPPRVMALFICVAGTLAELLLHGYGLAKESATPYRPALPASAWVISVLFIVVATRRNVPLQHWLGRRGVALSRKLGLATYPLYLVHHTVGSTLIQNMRSRIGAKPSLLVSLLLVTTLAFLIAAYPEPALRRLLRSGLNRWTGIHA